MGEILEYIYQIYHTEQSFGQTTEGGRSDK